MKTTKLYIARDKNGEIYFYSEKPTLRDDGTFIGPGFVTNNETFKDIKKGEVVSFEIPIK